MDAYGSFKNRLDEIHTWPGSYLFKFVVPEHKKGELLSLMPTGLVQERSSTNQKYVSISLNAMMESSDQVVAIYKQVAKIEGVVTL